MSHPIDSGALERLVTFYETLQRATLHDGIAAVYAEDAYFKDPFNEVRGRAAIEKIFVHMFEQVDAPRFVVTARAVQGTEAFLTWEFHFRMRRDRHTPQCIRGATHLRFDAAGAALMHRDYWDAAEELYEKVPLLGSLMRWLKRAVS